MAAIEVRSDISNVVVRLGGFNVLISLLGDIINKGMQWTEISC